MVAIALAVFATAAALDYAAARYTRSLIGDRLHAAARWSVAMALLSAVGVLALVDDPIMLAPECAGLYVGTILSGAKRAKVER